MVKPLKDNATDEEKAAYEEKLKANTSKATRILVLVRHGQYNLKGANDEEKYLTELGIQQASATGKRLAQLYSSYLQKLDSNGKVNGKTIILMMIINYKYNLINFRR